MDQHPLRKKGETMINYHTLNNLMSFGIITCIFISTYYGMKNLRMFFGIWMDYKEHKEREKHIKEQYEQHPIHISLTPEWQGGTDDDNY